MKKPLSLLAVLVLLFSFALADPAIGSLEWEICFWAERMRDAEMVSCVMDETDPDSVTCVLTLSYSLGGSEYAVASRLPEYCRQVLDHIGSYPECSGVTFRWIPAGDGRESVMVFSVTPEGYTLTEASGLVLVLIPIT